MSKFEPSAWDQLLPEAWHRWKLQEFQKRAITFSILTVLVRLD